MKSSVTKSNSLEALLQLATFFAVQLAALFLVSAAFAQNNSGTTSTLAPSVSLAMEELEKAAQPKKFGAAFALTSETNLEEQSSSQDQTLTTFEFVPHYRISSKAKAQALIAIERNENGLQETKVLNTLLSIVRDPIRLDDSTQLMVTAQALLPTEEEAREKSTLRGAGGFTAAVKHDLRILGKSAVATAGLNTLKYSHEFTRNADRAANTSYRLRYTGAVDVTLSKKFEAGIGGYYQTGFTYDNVVREAYQFEESVSYSLKDNVALALSHSTGGPLFEKDGREWAASFYDKSQSTVGARLTIVY